MPIKLDERFSKNNIYIDYPFDEVMFRWDYLSKKRYRKFYGKKEETESIPHYNHLYKEALRFGDEITYDEYIMGKLPDE